MRRPRNLTSVFLPDTVASHAETPAQSYILGRYQDPPISNRTRFVLIGCSAGGYTALTNLLSLLRPGFNTPILAVQHLPQDDTGGFAKSLQHHTPLTIIIPDDKTPVRPGHLYIAPANYHMLLNPSTEIALSVDELVRGSRPSIDLLLTSAATHFGTQNLSILLTGANTDGTAGTKAIAQNGGTTLAQDPEEAEFPLMPRSAIQSGHVQHVHPIAGIAHYLNQLA